jgi:hypothetical protein
MQKRTIISSPLIAAVAACFAMAQPHAFAQATAPLVNPTADAAPDNTHRAEWFRRLCVDLTGVPPTQQDLDAFLADMLPGSRERWVEVLMARRHAPRTALDAEAKKARIALAAEQQMLMPADVATRIARRTAQEHSADSRPGVATRPHGATVDMTVTGHDQLIGPRKPVGPARVIQPLPPQTVRRHVLNVTKATYMGVGVESPSETVRVQLSLPPGAGLVVNHVDPHGPTHSLVQLHDVLQKLDDQILVNAPQLIALVQMKKPGDEVTLTLLRKTKPHVVRAKLVEREVADAIDTTADLPTVVALPAATFTNMNIAGVPAAGVTEAGVLRTDGMVRAGLIRIEDGRWTFNIHKDAKPNPTVTVFDGVGGAVLFHGPADIDPNDPRITEIPESPRQRMFLWLRATMPATAPTTAPAGGTTGPATP